MKTTKSSEEQGFQPAGAHKSAAMPQVVIQDQRPEAAIQRKLHDQAQAPLVQRKENNTGLPDNLKSGIENLSGLAMDDVRVHRNSSKPAQLNAHAYAQGTDIHLAAGQEKHLPHEAWHVVQQKQGRVKPTRQLKSKVAINDDKGLEREADVMGARAARVELSSQQTIIAKESGNQRIVQKRSKNPHNPETGITSHHIIPHELLLKIANKFTEVDGFDEKAALKKESLPSFANLTAAQLVAQGTIAVSYNHKGDVLEPNKIKELPEKIRHQPFSMLGEEKGNFQFEVEDIGVLSFADFESLYGKLLTSKNKENYDALTGDDKIGVDNLSNLVDSFYEWQAGNLFYGPTRIEPAGTKDFDFDASEIYGGKVKDIHRIYKRLRDLESKNDAASKIEMRDLLIELNSMTKDVVVPKLDESIWVPITNEKQRQTQEVLTGRKKTSEIGKSIHKTVLLSSIRKYSEGNGYNMLKHYRGDLAGYNGLFSIDDKNYIALKADERLTTHLGSHITKKAIKENMMALLKDLFKI